ncbi:MAG TPA: helix-turn-helix domain-containing protein, partial [Phenylobacterium sp.]|nr:helix-turn-helix domain-containing protein [Phenylobacterium sp.]
MPTLESGPNIGAALKAAREFRGLSLQDVADSTCIRRAYLAAIEEMRLDDLPSRPFTVGYIRAYAKALGLDS